MVLVNVGAGAGIGSWASGTLYDLTGAYYAGFALAAVCGVAGLSFFWTMRSLSGATPQPSRA
jgi:predicted MFS family arabinose efflux permease